MQAHQAPLSNTPQNVWSKSDDGRGGHPVHRWI